MDPVTHALVGSATARLVMARPLGAAAWIPGAVGALLPDVDAAIRSSSDPLLYAEFHRHFTHSLAFIPVGGLIASVPWWIARRTRPQWSRYAAAATLGYATHGLLDATTTWGTRLLWPLSDARIGWNLMPIIDPLFTGCVATAVLVALWRRSARPLAVGLMLCLAYIALGVVQRERAEDAQALIARSRGHDVARAEVFPGFGTNVVWRSLYESNGVLHMDRLRVPWIGTATWREGPAVDALQVERTRPNEHARGTRAHDLARFLHFTNGWAARAPDEPDIIGDARYSMTIESYAPVWGIRFASSASEPPVAWIDRSPRRRVNPRDTWLEVIGQHPRLLEVP
jgi:inner membrane protein